MKYFIYSLLVKIICIFQRTNKSYMAQSSENFIAHYPDLLILS